MRQGSSGDRQTASFNVGRLLRADDPNPSVPLDLQRRLGTPPASEGSALSPAQTPARGKAAVAALNIYFAEDCGSPPFFRFFFLLPPFGRERRQSGGADYPPSSDKQERRSGLAQGHAARPAQFNTACDKQHVSAGLNEAMRRRRPARGPQHIGVKTPPSPSTHTPRSSSSSPPHCAIYSTADEFLERFRERARSEESNNGGLRLEPGSCGGVSKLSGQ